MMWNLLIGPVSDLLNTVLKRVLPPEKMSEAERAKLTQELELEMAKYDWSAVQGQLAINLEEAKSQNVFVAGWRPFVGWVCGAGMAWYILGQPLFSFLIGAYTWKLPPLPVLDTSTLMTVLLALLGLGGMRSFEKWKGVEGNRTGWAGK